MKILVDATSDGGRKAVFCPFEQIAAIFLTPAVKAKAQLLTLRFDGFPEVNITNPKSTRIGLGFSPEQRRSFLGQSEIVGSAILKSGSGTVERKFKVLHIGETDDFPSPAEVGNLISSTGSRYYVDETHDGDINTENYKVSTTAEVSLLDTESLVPAYMYVPLAALRDGYKIIIGPKAIVEKPRLKIGTIYQNGREKNLFVDPEALGVDVQSPPEVIHDVKPDVESVIALDKPRVLLRPSDKPDTLYPFTVAQNVLLVNGIEVDFHLVYQIILISALHQAVFRETEDLVIDLKRVAQTYVLADKFELEYASNCISNEYLKSVLGTLRYRDDALLINLKFKGDEEETQTEVAARGSTTCFALSLAYLFNLLTEGTIASYFDVLRALAENGAIVPFKNKAGRISAQGRTANKQNVKLTFTSNAKVYDLEWSRTDYTSATDLPRLSGYALMGLDKTSERDDPYHWIVVFIDKGIVKCVYNPYTANGPKFGDTLNDYFTYPDTRIAGFKIVSSNEEVLAKVPTPKFEGVA